MQKQQLRAIRSTDHGRPPAMNHRNRPQRIFSQSRKLQDVVYDIRGPVHDQAMRLEAQGHRILKLNIGNPAPFGFAAPDEIMRGIIHELPYAQGYSDSKGIASARRAVVARYEVTPGFPQLDIEHVYLGNGVSELITMTLQALLDNGDEVLIPAPDYPLWTAATALAGGTAVHYLCDETQGWQPDIVDIESRITERTKALVVINPNNPTGAVYSRETLRQIADVARKYELLLLADEIYDKILYDDATHISMASAAPDVLCLTFNGLSKAYRIAGYRAGWLAITGPKDHASSFLEGISLLANMRLCPNVPAQYGVQVALSGSRDIEDLLLPGGRLLEQRDVAWSKLNEIPGVSCVKPQGAMYAFPRLDPEVYDIVDDEQLVLDLLLQEKILVTQGSGFNWPAPDHLRIVTLPWARDLAAAIERLGNFLSHYRPRSASDGKHSCKPIGRHDLLRCTG
jgi:alanine-synthesizing transaminase